jgi:hypothetical protein
LTAALDAGAMREEMSLIAWIRDRVVTAGQPTRIDNFIAKTSKRGGLSCAEGHSRPQAGRRAQVSVVIATGKPE